MISVFIGVSLAFYLNQWSDEQKDKKAEEKILLEIRTGLKQDLQDMEVNIRGHQEGLKAVEFFKKLPFKQDTAQDSVMIKWFNLFRNFVVIQNSSGYESLKSKGLELIQDDSLRYAIIEVYDIEYEILEKLEEDYDEIQYHTNYFKPILDILAENMVFTRKAGLTIAPLSLEPTVKNKYLNYLIRIEGNRHFTLGQYYRVQEKLTKLIANLDEYLENH